MTTTSTSCSAMPGVLPDLPLALHEPAAALAVVEDHDIAPVGRDDLPVAAPQRLVGPPAILDQPRLADRLDVAAADGERAALGVGSHGDALRNRQAARAGHPSNGARTARRSGTRESGSTISTRSAASGPATARVWRTASRSRAARTTLASSSRWR